MSRSDRLIIFDERASQCIASHAIIITIITMTEMRERESNLMHSNRVQTLKIKISKF